MSTLLLEPWMGLRAALLLAGGRAEGAVRMGGEGPAHQLARARHSFLALLLCLPLFLGLQLLEGEVTGAAMLRGLASVVLGWLGYAVLSQALAASLGRAVLWPRFLALWSWCNLVQYLLMAAATVPGLLGAPAVVVQAAWLVALGWALWLQWSATRLALALAGGAAAMLVVADFALGVIVLRFVNQGFSGHGILGG
ncbi:MAG: hypothetical protein IT555_19940 [Acetobacteraceae bacterium]|nr:hypothetical protein [Acetobacteraceae bacterium]